MTRDFNADDYGLMCSVRSAAPLMAAIHIFITWKRSKQVIFRASLFSIQTKISNI